MTVRRVVTLAVPGDIRTRTGGYFYDRRLIAGLGELGWQVKVLELPASFPDPDPAGMQDALAALQAVPGEGVLIVDGLALGALDPVGLRQVAEPVDALVHHPLAMESGLDPARRDHLHRTERQNLRHARHVLVPSPHVRDLLVSGYAVAPDQITVARPGTDRPRPGARQAVTPPLVLSVGILHPRKGHDVLIRALAAIADLDWQAVIVGGARDPGHAEALRQLIVECGLADRLRLAGEVSEDRLDALYRRASVFALATRYEGYGIVFDEALSNGLPIIACDSGAVRDTVPPEAGLLVPPEDCAAFADALRTVLDDPARMQAMAFAAASAGRALPGWDGTARIAGAVLNAIGDT